MIADNLQQVRARIARACVDAGRPVESVTLLAVSKRAAPDAVRAALLAGEHRFGENLVQEGVEKIAALADLRERIEWHLIGPLQSNKTRVVAEQFDWVHTIDRLKVAERLPRSGRRTCRRCRSACRSTSAAKRPRAAWRRPMSKRPRMRSPRCRDSRCAA